MMKACRQVPDSASNAADIIRDANGRIVGRTRLQKIAYLLEVAGLGCSFEFEYRHYGPYSEALARAVEHAELFELINAEERPTNWKGRYSIYTSSGVSKHKKSKIRKTFIDAMRDANSVELELAATAVFLCLDGELDPWRVTASRKPDKATTKYLEGAKRLYASMRNIRTPKKLPKVQ